jgi:hypothetical protein
MKKSTFVASAIAAALIIPAQAAFAGPAEDTIGQTEAFNCDAGLPPGHCINVKSQGNTGVILVFEEDGFRQEGISFNPKADARPCRHDDEATDETWWSPMPGTYVCHHTP